MRTHARASKKKFLAAISAATTYKVLWENEGAIHAHWHSVLFARICICLKNLAGKRAIRKMIDQNIARIDIISTERILSNM